MTEIVNRVANSKIVSFDMEDYLPKKSEIVTFDLADYLFQGMVLREKDFRQELKAMDWSVYEGKYVLVTCSADAIVQIWAYMLVASYLGGVAKFQAQNEETLFVDVLKASIEQLHVETDLTDKPVVIKGCSNIPFKESLYLEATKGFLPYAKSIMYGEPCSMVPVFKKKK